MATKTVHVCDRCGHESDTEGGRMLRKGKPYDLCESCTRALDKWLEGNNATMPGDDPGWVQVCTHSIPCGGPCNSGTYRRAQ